MSIYIEKALVNHTGLSPSMEGISDYIGMVRRVASAWQSEVADRIAEIKAPRVRLKVSRKLKVKLDSVPFNAWGKIHGIKPKGLNDNLLPFILHLERQLEAVSDVHTRLYIPLTRYIRSQIAMPEERDKIWTDKNLSHVDVSELQRDLNSFYGRDAGNSRGDERAAIESFISGPREFHTCADALIGLEKKLDAVDFRAIQKAEGELHEVIELYVKTLQSGEALPSENVGNIKRFELAIYNTAVETEMLAVTTYLIKTAHSSYMETCELLERGLEV